MGLSSHAEARFAGKQMYYASGADTHQAAVIAACRVEVKAYNKNNPSPNPALSVIGATRVSDYGPILVNEPYYCSVRFKDNSVSNYFGGVGGEYVCPPNASAVSVRSDGQFYQGGVACECNSGYEEKYGQCAEYSAVDSVASADKNAGGGDGCSLVGNPVNPATGSKFLSETDYFTQTGPLPLAFVRTYNSVASGSARHEYFDQRLTSAERPSNLGRGWRHNYERYLDFDNGNVLEGAIGDGSRVVVVRPNGAGITFTRQIDGTYTAEGDVNHRFEAIGAPTPTTYRFINADDDSTEHYNTDGQLVAIDARGGWSLNFSYSDTNTPANRAPAAGMLLTVEDATGRTLELSYNDGGLVSSVIDPDGQAISYEYDELNRLTTVAYQDNTTRTYHYAETDHLEDQADQWGSIIEADLDYALTGITDERNKRFATYRYRADGRAISTEHGVGSEKFRFSYNTDGTVSVIDPLGTERQYQYTVKLGNRIPAGADKACAAPGDGNQKFAHIEFDENGSMLHRIDHQGNRTDFLYNVRNLEEKRIEGLTSTGASTAATRTISTQWHPDFQLPSLVAEPKRIVQYQHDTHGNVQTITEWATSDANGAQGFSATKTSPARVTTFTYNAVGQVKTIDGPRSGAADTTTFEYYEDTNASHAVGDLWRISNALGHTTTFSEYDAHGRPLTVIDPNGQTTQFSYDLRGRTEAITRGSDKTVITYYENGLTKTVSAPDGSYSVFEYDDAQRLTRVTDGYGNRIDSQLDGVGTPELQQVWNAASQLVSTMQLTKWPEGWTKSIEHGHRGKLTYAYEPNGNLETITDVAGKITTLGYDALNRVRSIQKPATGLVTRDYDGLDQLTAWTDGRALATSISVDGLGNTTGVVSPDAGTASMTHDLAGNIETRTDAKGQVTTYVYDALNRIVQATYADGRQTEYGYDAGTFGLGRLTSVTEKNSAGDTVYVRTISYRQDGKPSSETVIAGLATLTTSYSYDSTGRLQTLTYPSGRTVTLGYDANGQIKSVVTKAPAEAEQTVASNATYFPFGGLAGFTAGNGLGYQRSFGQDGKVEGYRVGSTQWELGYDTRGRIQTIGIQGNATSTTQYGHDDAGRITSAVTPNATYGYTYDDAGNRQTATAGSAVTNYAYPATSNRLAALSGSTIVHDPNGSMTLKNALTLSYDTSGRVSGTSQGSVSMEAIYEGNANRVTKETASGTRIFIYGPQGELIAEHAGDGKVLGEFIYLGGAVVGAVAP